MNGWRLSVPMLLVAISALVLSACNREQQVALGGTRAWIDIPRDRSVISLKPHEVIAHASDASGLLQVELLVNGNSIGALACENIAQPLVTCRGMWNPIASGDYRLEARAKNQRGATGLSAPVYVSIGVAGAPITAPPEIFTLTPTRAPTRAPTLPSPSGSSPPPEIYTLTPTRVPTRAPTLPSPSVIAPVPEILTLTPTRTPIVQLPTDIPCPGAPVVSSFFASPSSIIQGQTSILSWGSVSNATSVEIDQGIGGVPTPGSITVSPNTTTAYILTARGCGGAVTRQVVIQVQVQPTRTPTRTLTVPPPQPPAAPSGLHQISRACSSPDQIRIGWNDNSNNESGFRIYRRLRENSSSPWSAWALRATVGANTEQYTDASGFNKSQDVEYGVESYNSAGPSARPTVFLSECPF